MRGSWHIWLAFSLALALSLAGMGWVSLTALRLDDSERRAQLEAARDENVKLALWRIDSALAPLLAQENYRPYFTYQAFYPAERAYTRLFQPVDKGDVLVPSPLLSQVSLYIVLHFQFDPRGEIASPQVPDGNMRDLAEVAYTTHEGIVASAARLERLKGFVNRARLLLALPEPEPPQEIEQPGGTQARSPAAQPRRPHDDAGNPRQAPDDDWPDDEQAPNEGEDEANDPQEGSFEWQARMARAVLANSILGPPQTEQQQAGARGRPGPVKGQLMTPIWIIGELFLARRVSMEDGDYVQGCWLDWGAIRTWLLADINDLLPQADLVPVTSEAMVEPARTMAGLPVRLVPGPLPAQPPRGLSPVQLTLIIAWGCVAVAGVAVGVVLHTAMSLSERRGAFVSAVTHEMRTPLTTFQMYTEMLVEGMVTDPEKRLRYLTTLRAQAERLSHLVENVLAYARLERGPKGRRMAAVTLGGLVDDVRERFAERASHAGMKFVVEAGDDQCFIRADTSAVERILFNLVDNSCKYASGGEDKRIHLVLDRAGRYARLRVWDHGPGITQELALRLFRPFSKSAHDAAHSAPGIGLGLALSRRLARRMGGDLVLDRTFKKGACFVLTLPAS